MRARGSKAAFRRGVVIVAVVALAAPMLVAESLADNRLSGGRHWGDGSLSREYVTIVDYTPSGWPVYAAAIKWDEAPRLDVVYQYGTCSGSYGHCIGVRLISQSDYGYTCLESGGFAYVPAQSGSSHISDSAYIRFNSACGSSSFTNRDRRALACEEEGHIIGLGHDRAYTDVTCMGSGRIDQLDETPREHDFTELHEMYGHSH